MIEFKKIPLGQGTNAHMDSRPPVPRHKIPLKPGKTLAAWMQDKMKVFQILVSIYSQYFISFLDTQFYNTLVRKSLAIVHYTTFGAFFMERFTI